MPEVLIETVFKTNHHETNGAGTQDQGKPKNDLHGVPWVSVQILEGCF